MSSSGRQPVDADPADAPALDPLGLQPQPLELDLLALPGHPADQVEQQAPDRVPLGRGQLDVEQLVDLVDAQAALTR